MNKIFPKRVIVYRDGMSKGEHAYAKNMEFDQITAVAKNEGINQVHYIVCKKKESAKFYKVNGGSFGNPEPGTIITSEVTENRVNELQQFKTVEFYLLS